MQRTNQDSQHRTGGRITETILFQTSNIVKFVKESRTQTWRDGGLAVLIVWFIWSATSEHTSLRLMSMQTHPMCLHLGFFSYKYSAHHGNLTQAMLHCCRPYMSQYFNVSNVVYFQEICQRPKFIAEGATRFDVEQGEQIVI